MLVKIIHTKPLQKDNFCFLNQIKSTHRMARTNVNKREKLVTNITGASKFILTYKAQNQHQLKSPLSDHNLLI